MDAFRDLLSWMGNQKDWAGLRGPQQVRTLARVVGGRGEGVRVYCPAYQVSERKADPSECHLCGTPIRRHRRESIRLRTWLPALISTSLWLLDLTCHFASLHLSLFSCRDLDVSYLLFVTFTRHCAQSSWCINSFHPEDNCQKWALFYSILGEKKRQTE